MNLKSLTISAGILLIMAILLSGVGSGPLAATLSLLLVFVLPGYALTKALFPGSQMEFAELIALTLGLSLAITALGGLILHWLPWRLETRSWTILLGSISFFASLIALLRQMFLNELPPSFIRVNLSFSFNDGLYFLLASIGVAIAFVLAYQGEVIQTRSNITQLWILPDETTESSYSIGIDNLGEETVQYRLVITIDDRVEQESPVIELNPQESWVRSFPMDEGTKQVKAQIYRLDPENDLCREGQPLDLCQQSAEAFREVELWSQETQ